MDLTELAASINKFNNSKPDEARNVIKTDKEYEKNSTLYLYFNERDRQYKKYTF